MRDPFTVPTPFTPWKGSFHARAVVAITLLAVVSACSAGGATPSASPPATPSATTLAASQAATASTAATASAAATAPAAASAAPASPAATAPPGSPAATAAPVSPAPSAAAFPVTLKDDEGTSVVIPAEPRHIVSLSPANTEILFALGAGPRVVAGTDQDDYPPEAAALPDVATFTGVALDKVTALEPDLVIAGGNGFTPPDAIKRLRDLHFPVLVVYAKTVDDVLADIKLIGAAAGEAPAAGQITAGMQSQMDQVTTAVKATTGTPRTFYEIGFGPDIYAPAPGFFTTQMIELAGGYPITTGNPNVFSIPLEKLVAADPEVIVVGDALYGTCPADVEGRSGWGTMTAVKTHAVRPINDIVVTRPGPRLPLGLAALAKAIHPEVSLPPSLAPTDPQLCVGAPGSPAPASPTP